MRALFAATGAQHPSDLTENAVIDFCSGNGRHLANNTIRGRTNVAACFLRWCAKHGITCLDAAVLTDRDSPLRRYRATYGKAQGKKPPRWLTKDEAFTTLIAACQDGTATGMRDEIVLRLGLLGLRATEIGTLVVGSVQLDTTPPQLAWIGKGRKPRRVVPGPTLVALSRQYLAHYAEQIDRPLIDSDPVIPPKAAGRKTNARRELQWGHPTGDPYKTIYNIVTHRAALADVGHVAPHDLRRTSAGLLHRDKSADGAHHFDLLDIQKHLGHSDPATTMRSYLDPMDTGVIERAATVLD